MVDTRSLVGVLTVLWESELRITKGRQIFITRVNDGIYEKTCFSTGRIEYFIETFRARGHSSNKLTKFVSF